METKYFVGIFSFLKTRAFVGEYNHAIVFVMETMKKMKLRIGCLYHQVLINDYISLNAIAEYIKIAKFRKLSILMNKQKIGLLTKVDRSNE